MKKIIKTLLILTIVFCYSIPVFATETTEQQNTSKYNSPKAQEVVKHYDELISKLTTSLFYGEITQEEYDETVELYRQEQEEYANNYEEQWLEEKYLESLPEVDYTVNHKDVYDDEGNKIIDFTDIDINKISSKKVLTFNGVIEPGTKPIDGFSIKVQVSAETLIFTEIAILDETNNYNCQILVPNDTYTVQLTPISSDDTVIFNDNYIDASNEPTLNVYIVGATKIIDGENEINLIEGEDYIEKEPQQQNNMKQFKIISIILIVIGLIALVIYAIRKKKELEL